jgi:hypothetical protein
VRRSLWQVAETEVSIASEGKGLLKWMGELQRIKYLTLVATFIMQSIAPLGKQHRKLKFV